MIIEYIKKVISKWWILLGFIPEVFDKFSVYFDSELKIPEGSTLYLFLALLFISTYLVWKEEKEKVKALEEKNRNPVDYEIIAQIHPFDDDVENSIIELKNIIDDTQKEIDEINNSLTNDNQSKSKIKVKLIENEPTTQYQIAALLCGSMHSMSQDIINNNTIVQNQRQIIYRDYLMDYITNMHNYIEQMKDYYESRKDKIFYVVFNIHNTGSIFDENIDINILSKNSIFSEKIEFDNIPEIPNKPEKIKNDYYHNPPDISKLFDSSFLDNLEDLNTHRLRRNVEIKDTNINLVFRDLKVDNQKNVLENILFIKSDDLTDLEFEISSKNSNKKIQKKVKLEMKDKLTKQNIYNILHPNEND